MELPRNMKKRISFYKKLGISISKYPDSYQSENSIRIQIKMIWIRNTAFTDRTTYLSEVVWARQLSVSCDWCLSKSTEHCFSSRTGTKGYYKNSNPLRFFYLPAELNNSNLDKYWITRSCCQVMKTKARFEIPCLEDVEIPAICCFLPGT